MVYWLKWETHKISLTVDRMTRLEKEYDDEKNKRSCDFPEQNWQEGWVFPGNCKRVGLTDFLRLFEVFLVPILRTRSYLRLSSKSCTTGHITRNRKAVKNRVM